jgi:DNA-binding LacI/PurR family transcriptional regulator
VGRPANRKGELVGYLREAIVSGRLLPGERMPTHEQLIQQFGASSGTVNNALTELRECGFVEVRGSLGTFVSDSLPYQTRYAVVFGRPKGETAGQGYTASLAKECARVRKTQVDERELEIVPFYGLNRDLDSPDYNRLMAEVRAHRIAGIIAANDIWRVFEEEDIVASKIPLVANAVLDESFPFSSIKLDDSAFMETAIESLHQRGAKRPGLIFSVTDKAKYSSEWRECIASHGMSAEPYCIQTVNLASPEAARNIAHLMMMLADDRRPDSMVIVDDNLVPYATAGLRDAGITPTDTFPIVAHANFPWPTDCLLPALRVGFDLAEMIRICVGIIDRMRSNGGATEHQTVAAVSHWDAGLAP